MSIAKFSVAPSSKSCPFRGAWLWIRLPRQFLGHCPLSGLSPESRQSGSKPAPQKNLEVFFVEMAKVPTCDRWKTRLTVKVYVHPQQRFHDKVSCAVKVHGSELRVKVLTGEVELKLIWSDDVRLRSVVGMISIAGHRRNYKPKVQREREERREREKKAKKRGPKGGPVELAGGSLFTRERTRWPVVQFDIAAKCTCETCT